MKTLNRTLILIAAGMAFIGCQSMDSSETKVSRAYPDHRTPYYYPPPVLNDRVPASYEAPVEEEEAEAEESATTQKFQRNFKR